MQKGSLNALLRGSILIFFLTKHFWARDEKVPGDFFFYKKLLFGGSKTALKRVFCINGFWEAYYKCYRLYWEAC